MMQTTEMTEMMFTEVEQKQAQEKIKNSDAEMQVLKMCVKCKEAHIMLSG